MKIIIKNDNRDIVKNPNVKIVETTESTFTNQVVILENNDVPIIKYTDTQSMYFIKDLDNLYDRKSKSEVLLDITIDNLELIGGSSSGEFIPLSGTEVGSPVTGGIEYLSISEDYETNKGFYQEQAGQGGGFTHSVDGASSTPYIHSFNQEGVSRFTFDGYGLYLGSTITSFKGIVAENYLGNYYEDNTYVQKKYVDEKVADSRPYKVYTALLTQTGTDAPVATVLENTLGEITWTRGGFGQYTGNSSEIFTLNKTLIFLNDNYSSFTIPKPLGKITLEPHPSVDTILVLQTGGTSSEINNGMSDDMLLNTPIEIRVYN